MKPETQTAVHVLRNVASFAPISFEASQLTSVADALEQISTEDFDAIRAGLEYASEAFANCSTSEDVAWRREDNAKLTAAWLALEKLEGML